MQQVFDLTYMTSLVDLHTNVYVILCGCVRVSSAKCLVCVRACVRARVDFVGLQNKVA